MSGETATVDAARERALALWAKINVLRGVQDTTPAPVMPQILAAITAFEDAACDAPMTALRILVEAVEALEIARVMGRQQIAAELYQQAWAHARAVLDKVGRQ